jgi:outer membrane biosynthesis protein TonB
MPIEPLDNPYRVIQSLKSRNVRRVERREPDEQREKNELEGETSDEAVEEPKEVVKDEAPPTEPKHKTPPDEDEKEKQTIDIRV